MILQAAGRFPKRAQPSFFAEEGAMTEGSNFPTIGGNQTPEDREAVGVGPEKVGRPGDEGKP